MKKIFFTKMVASGNDFVVVDHRPQTIDYRLKDLAKKICDRKYAIGADGLLILEKSKVADIKMRIFNADGSEADMCGNGARCVALWAKARVLKIETKAGIINSTASRDNVRIRLTDPKDIKLDIPLVLNKRRLNINFVNTGVPHVVIFSARLDQIDIIALGRLIRYHKKFYPQGTNVDFIEFLDNHSLKIRTYERGVEDETLACGTGSVAAAIIFSLKTGPENKINVHTKGGEILKVYFDKNEDKIRNIWLEGKARVICKGEFYV